MKYRTIVADPPWRYETTTPLGDGAAERQYPTMAMDELVAVPVRGMADKDAHLYLWTTNPLLFEARWLMEAWGFRYITLLTWHKLGPIGMGFYFRGDTEHVLFGVRGKAPIEPAIRVAIRPSRTASTRWSSASVLSRAWRCSLADVATAGMCGATKRPSSRPRRRKWGCLRDFVVRYVVNRSGEGGIRTHGPLRVACFQVRTTPNDRSTTHARPNVPNDRQATCTSSGNVVSFVVTLSADTADEVGGVTARTKAIVLQAYAGLRDECLRRHEDTDGMHDFITGLHESWASAIRRAGPLRYEGRVELLLREIADPDKLDPDSDLRWLDLFPELVIETTRGVA